MKFQILIMLTLVIAVAHAVSVEDQLVAQVATQVEEAIMAELRTKVKAEIKQFDFFKMINDGIHNAQSTISQVQHQAGDVLQGIEASPLGDVIKNNQDLLNADSLAHTLIGRAQTQEESELYAGISDSLQAKIASNWLKKQGLLK